MFLNFDFHLENLNNQILLCFFFIFLTKNKCEVKRGSVMPPKLQEKVVGGT